jgi:hypothetical protein
MFLLLCRRGRAGAERAEEDGREDWVCGETEGTAEGEGETLTKRESGANTHPPTHTFVWVSKEHPRMQAKDGEVVAASGEKKAGG